MLNLDLASLSLIKPERVSQTLDKISRRALRIARLHAFDIHPAVFYDAAVDVDAGASLATVYKELMNSDFFDKMFANVEEELENARLQ